MDDDWIGFSHLGRAWGWGEIEWGPSASKNLEGGGK